MDDFTGNTFRLVLSEDADAGTAESALREHEAEGGFPIELLRLNRSAGPVRKGAYREEVRVLTPWLQRQSCEAVLARPDHYVFGGVRRVRTDIGRLLADARRQWSGSNAGLFRKLEA
ncbi:hypothetical protein ACFPH6_01230 [Streptomyces xiangluensis]|uniref:Uncharacterized protein n=1 Tax=Streptomyces xiangluensis TaxID=2665720 RepID=A0ABV8YD20_9ACTN